MTKGLFATHGIEAMPHVDAGEPVEGSGTGEVTLKRALTARHLTMLGIGAVIGAGIFVLTGTAAAQFAGPALVVSFLMAGFACALAGVGLWFAWATARGRRVGRGVPAEPRLTGRVHPTSDASAAGAAATNAPATEGGGAYFGRLRGPVALGFIGPAFLLYAALVLAPGLLWLYAALIVVGPLVFVARARHLGTLGRIS